MAKCKYCNKNIEHLYFNRVVLGNETGVLNNDETHDIDDGQENTLSVCYYCPICLRLLFKREDRAINFLKGVD